MQRPLQLEFYAYLPKQKRNTKSSSNPFNAKISFEAYLHILVSKAEEGNYENYNLQGDYLCTLSFCCCWDRGWGALTHFYFLTSLKRRFFCFMITSVTFSLIFSVIKWSSVKIYVWSAFFHFRQYSYHVTRFVIFFLMPI